MRAAAELNRAAALLFLAAAPAAWSATCAVEPQDVAFGSYSPIESSPRDSTGLISISCTAELPVESVSYTVSISASSTGFDPRGMSDGGNVLNYNLYLDAQRTTIWGDGTAGTATVSGSLTPPVASAATHVVYGRVPQGQAVSPGSYADMLVVSLDF